MRAWFCAGVVGTCFWHSNDRSRSAEHAHAADRFAREIIGILTVVALRLRRLMGNPLGGYQTYRCLVLERCCNVLWFTNAVLFRKTESSVV